jgi:DNA-binding Xre family transcriptional regulator
VRMTFGEQLRSIRRRRELSQETLVGLTGLHRAYVGMVEPGARRNMRLDTFLALCRAPEVPPGPMIKCYAAARKTGRQVRHRARLHGRCRVRVALPARGPGVLLCPARDRCVRHVFGAAVGRVAAASVGIGQMLIVRIVAYSAPRGVDGSGARSAKP